MDLVRLPLERAVASAGARVAALDYVLVRLAAGGGLEGLGYACLYAAAPTGGAHGGALRVLAGDLAPLVEGEDVRLRGRVWRALWRASAALGHGDLALAAVSAYDLALWDLAGKAAGLPVWQLLGAVRDRLPVYYSGLFLGATEAELVAEAAPLAGQGYRAAKMRVGRPTPEEDAARVAAVREALDPGVRLLADCSRSLDAGRAIRLGGGWRPWAWAGWRSPSRRRTWPARRGWPPPSTCRWRPGRAAARRARCGRSWSTARPTW